MQITRALEIEYIKMKSENTVDMWLNFKDMRKNAFKTRNFVFQI